MEINLGEIDWTVLRYLRGFTKDPAFLQPRQFRHRWLTTSPSSFTILVLVLYPNSKKQRMSQSFSNNTNSLNTTVNISNTAVTNILTLADDRRDLLCWLSPLDPKLRHQDIQARRVEDVGEWLLETEEFRRWDAGSGGDESDNAVLFCYGDPGVGKTYIR